jgi:predicted transcriptional regulator
MRLNIMNRFDPQHNANLHQILPEQASIVNNQKTVDACSASLDVSLADTEVTNPKPDKLFVKIDNAIYNYLLKPRLLEFYCLLSYLVFNYPRTELPILTIQSLILKHRGYKMSKNTINKYLNVLIELGLIKRVQKYYIISNLRGNGGVPLIQEGGANSDGSCINGLYRTLNSSSISSLDTSNLCNLRPIQATSLAKEDPQSASCLRSWIAPSKTEVVQNMITLPKDNYTPFYITPYTKNPKSGSLTLELYLASKPYDRHRPSKVCRDLNISRKTYYTYLRDIISKSLVKRIKLSYNNYHYTHDYRLVLWAESCDRMKGVYERNKIEWQKTKPKNSVNNSRRWYVSSMARVMKQYGVNYIKAFDCYNPEDAYAIVLELEKQYDKFYKPLTAAIIVKGIISAYNWTKIVDKRHAEVKAGMFKVNNNVFDRMFRVDYS